MTQGIKNVMKQLLNEPSTNGKIAILKANFEDEMLQQVLYYTYNSDLKYGITLRQLKKDSDGRKCKWNDIFDMLDELAESNINNELRMEILAFLEEHEEDRDLITKILVKDFKNGVKTSTINKVWKGLIPVFAVQKPESNEKLKLKKDEPFALFIKYNGARGTYISGELKTRQGKVINGLDHIIKDIQQVFGLNMVVEGEIVHKNQDGLSDGDNMRRTLSILNGSDLELKKDLMMYVFDVVPRQEFNKDEFTEKFLDTRLGNLNAYNDRLTSIIYKDRDINNLTYPNIDIISPLYVGNKVSKIDEYLELADSKGLEGLCLYKNVVYKKNKTTGVIKVKTFYYSDIVVTGWFEGKEGTALEGKFGGFIVDYKGHPLKIGGGFDEKDRDTFIKDPQSYIGSVIEIKYKSESKNKDGGISLQFATFSRLRTDKDSSEISYES